MSIGKQNSSRQYELPFMKPASRTTRLFALCGMLLLCADAYGVGAENRTGKVVLYALDADTGKPIENVKFVKENLLAEDWAVTVGTTGKDGAVRLESRPLPGYFFSAMPVPKGYKVSSLDEVPSRVEVGKTVEHRFHLRKLAEKPAIPELIPLENSTGKRFEEVLRIKSNEAWFSLTLSDVPGFEGRKVKFAFSRENAFLAELIYKNGKRVRAALHDELRYFQKAEGRSAGDVSAIYDVEFLICAKPPRASSTSWYLRCQTKNGIKLRDGFEVRFEKLDLWDLEIPAYVHPDF